MTGQAAGVRQNPLAAMRQAQQAGAQMAGQANMQAAQIRSQEQLAGQQALMSIAAQDAAAQNMMVGGLLNAGSTALSGGLAGMAQPAAQAAVGGLKDIKSDIRAKTNIGDGAPAVEALVNNPPQPITYRYRDPADGTGQRLGVAAQQLPHQLTRIGSDGQLQIDGPKALGANLAVSAQLAQRLNALESQQPYGYARLQAAPIGSAERLAQSLERKRLHAADLAYQEAQRRPALAAAPVAAAPVAAAPVAAAPVAAAAAPVVVMPTEVAPAPAPVAAPEVQSGFADLYERPGLARNSNIDLNNALLLRSTRRAAQAARGR